MQKFIIRFFKVYILFVLFFIFDKLLFIVWNYSLYSGISISDILAVVWHGLPHDASMAGYLTVLPGLFLIASIWANDCVMKIIQRVYYCIFAFVLSLIFLSDAQLYGYWGFRLDSTPLFYLKTPKDAMASISVWAVVFSLIGVVVLAACMYLLMNRWLVSRYKKTTLRRPLLCALCLFFLTAALFLPIRGGVSVSTMNVGKVYYSTDMRLNHAAVNPVFSFFKSITSEQDFASQYRFMPDEEAAAEFLQMVDQPVQDSVQQLFTTERPNIVFFVLESFMSKVIEPLDGIPGITPCLSKYAEEGILFTNFYANSFRTDRGLVSILGAYPAQPTTSIMKFPHKTQSLPSFPAALKNEGYDLQYYYGGDADFTNMRSYLRTCGFEKIVCDADFPISQRLSKWGAHDDVLFSRLIEDFGQIEQSQPFLKVVQTSSSHEPFDVPYSHFEDPYLNSVAFTDSCIGSFVEAYRNTPYWDNTILVFVPDHAMRYPFDIENHDVNRYKIPLIIVGGAVREQKHIDTYASQIDIAATLLYQMGINHEAFTFSKNILNPTSPHFGWYTCKNFFGMVTPDNILTFDCDAMNVVADEGENKSANLKKGQAYLQKLYDDLSNR